jgi:hypothetical protein
VHDLHDLKVIDISNPGQCLYATNLGQVVRVTSNLIGKLDEHFGQAAQADALPEELKHFGGGGPA